MEADRKTADRQQYPRAEDNTTLICFKMFWELKERYHRHSEGGGEGDGAATIYAP